MAHLAPSITSANFCRLGEEVNATVNAGADYIHFDVMDGCYVPQISFGMPVLSCLRKETDAILDVHMMTVSPERYIETMRECGADIITVHQEACVHLDRVIAQIKACGAKACVALNPATDVSTLKWVLPQLDMVLVMSVNPGFGGQSLIPYCIEKIAELDRIRKENGYHYLIEVDGGVKLNNCAPIVKAGADVLVAGSAVFAGDIKKNTRDFLDAFRKAESER